MHIMCLIYGAYFGSQVGYINIRLFTSTYEGRLISPWPEIETFRTIGIIGVSATIQRNIVFCHFVVYQNLIFEVTY